MSWLTLQWVLIRHHLLDQGDTILAAGDHVVVTKAWQKDLRPRSIFSRLSMAKPYGVCVSGYP